MVFSDTIIETDTIFLRNLNKNCTTVDAWSTASSSYGFYSVPYEHPLGAKQVYYARYTYKFTTTNQSPTWVQFYSQGGTSTWSSTTNIANPTAGTEYTASAVGRINNSSTGITLTTGTLYNGNSGAIAGVSAQAKNVLVYEITELYAILRANNIAKTDTEVKTWCDNNLECVPAFQNYDITSLITNTINHINIKAGSIISNEYVEAEGMRFYATTEAIGKNCYFDTGSAVSVYNNSGGGTVTHTRVDAKEQDSPFWVEHPYVLQITTNGTASPGAGGFYCAHTAAANKIVVEKFVAKVPTGYTVTSAYNAQGTGASVTFISPRAGTGDWEEYTILYKCGSEGSFSTGGHVYISGSNNTSVTWYVAYCISCTITENENLKNFTVLGNVDRIKGGYFFSRKFDNMNLIPNGNAAKQISSMLPSGWSYDTDDVAGSAKASIVQPVNAGAGDFGGLVKIVPGQRYKVSYWVKCKGDMTSFLTAIIPYIDTTTSKSHGDIIYVVGTKAQLAAALNPGDTTITVKTNQAKNWIDRTYGGIGIRANSTRSYNSYAWNPNGSTGVISGNNGNNIINLKTAYTGTAQAVNTYIVERYDGGTYPYPIQKESLPTDNTWKYVEGYFGDNAIWDGNSNSGWVNIPWDCPYVVLRLNIYANTGTVPIKYSDIRIEPIKAGGLSRYEEKIDIIGGN